LVFAGQAKVHTVVTVRNGTGSYSSNHLAFYDANGTHLVLDGVHGTATITYPDQTVLTFPYSQTVSGLSVTGSWSGADESGYLYTATLQETLVQTRHEDSARCEGYRTTTDTSPVAGAI